MSPKFENTWNLTNLISLGVIAVGGLGAFFTVQAKANNFERAVATLEQRIDKIQQTTDTEQRMSEQRILSRLDAMQTDIREIRAAQLRKGRE
jgi:hypothetical protein